MTHRSRIALVLFCFCLCGSGALLSHYLANRVVTPRPAELYAVIYRQVQALQRADYPAAYQQVALETQHRFTLDQFSELVRTSYPTLARARRVEFGQVQIQGAHAFIQVFLFGEAETPQPSIFQLSNEGGGWKIIGARLLRRDQPSSLLRGVQA